MARAPTLILAIALGFWLTDLGLARRAHQPTKQPPPALACRDQAQSPGSDGSDLEIVVCATPSR